MKKPMKTRKMAKRPMKSAGKPDRMKLEMSANQVFGVPGINKKSQLPKKYR